MVWWLVGVNLDIQSYGLRFNCGVNESGTSQWAGVSGSIKRDRAETKFNTSIRLCGLPDCVHTCFCSYDFPAIMGYTMKAGYKRNPKLFLVRCLITAMRKVI